MPRVFVIQENMRLDRETGNIVPSKDLSSATFWGEIIYVLPPRHDHYVDHLSEHSKVADLIASRLSDIRPEDYLLFSGPPEYIAIAGAVVAARLGAIRFLKWNRKDRYYLPVRVELFRFVDDAA